MPGCKTSFVLIEYAYNLDIPDEVMDSDIIRSLGEAANDLVTWSNVCCPAFLRLFMLLIKTHFHRALHRPFYYVPFTCPNPLLVPACIGHLFLQCRAVEGRYAQYDLCRHE